MKTALIWEKSLKFLESKIGIQAVDSWFKPVVLKDINNDEIHIEAPNKFFKEWIEERHYQDFSDALRQTAPIMNPVFIWTFSENKKNDISSEQSPPSHLPQQRPSIRNISLNPKYTFDTFVVGSSNQFAHAASSAVAENPGKTYNPLFIYGGVGLGKTHLVHAVGNALRVRLNNVKISYVSAEEFTNDVIQSIRHDKMDEFRKKYRNLDVLLVDDIHFIAGKDRTQEEFFHTFNALYESEKQIIITSDRFPNEIPSITDRLRSRFSWGLIADIQAPDIETRIAILEKKAEQHAINISRDVATYIAKRVKSNVRDLEGALVRLGAFSSLTGKAITTESAAEILKGIINDQEKPITAEVVLKSVADFYGIKVLDLKSKKRTREVAIPRQVAMHLCKQLTDLSLADIGFAFGGKDHSTVIHACKQVRTRMDSDEDFVRKIQVITERIKGER